MAPFPLATSHQGHIGAAECMGCIYQWGQGTAIDFPRAMAAYKVGAKGGNAACQHRVGLMYYAGLGVDVDYAQALAWIGRPEPEGADGGAGKAKKGNGKGKQGNGKGGKGRGGGN